MGAATWRSGVRVQWVKQDGSLIDDSKIAGTLHVLNVPPPAVTASLMIAHTIVGTAIRSWSRPSSVYFIYGSSRSAPRLSSRPRPRPRASGWGPPRRTRTWLSGESYLRTLP